jgi:dTDP-4-dehydrorhamnose reductase
MIINIMEDIMEPRLEHNIHKNDVFVIFGRSGLLGREFHNKMCAVVNEYRVFGFDHSRVDITEREQVRDVLEYLKPTIVINCAAISDMSICEEAKAGAFLVNAKGPAVLAVECDAVGAKLVHMSSCCVFDGHRILPYSEKTTRSRTIDSMLGKTRLAGEAAVAKACKNHLIIRPGWIFHEHGENYVTNWINTFPEILVEDCHGSPTYIPDLVDATIELLTWGAKGAFHVANSCSTTMQQFAETTAAYCNSNAKVACKKRTKPNLPMYSVLSTKKYMQTTGNELRPWQDALKQCLFNMGLYKP